MKRHPSFVVIGGGTGTYSVLSGLKEYTNSITAIVTMADSGGSAKKERDEWGLLPSSDIRKSLLALADVSHKDSLYLRKLMQYRYSEGTGLEGMSFGNLMLVTLTRILGSQEKAIEKAGKLLHIRGRVLPVTLEKVHLVAAYEDGSVIEGEHDIDEPSHNGSLRITRFSTKPKAQINPRAREAIENADVIIIGPGGFYTTILANLVIGGVAQAIKKSAAKKFFIVNLMTEYGQTYQFSAKTFLDGLDAYLPSSLLDYVLINNAPIPKSVLTRYIESHAQPVVNDIPKDAPYTVVSTDLLSEKVIRREKGDSLQRSLIRHSPEKIARVCMKLLNLV